MQFNVDTRQFRAILSCLPSIRWSLFSVLEEEFADDIALPSHTCTWTSSRLNEHDGQLLALFLPEGSKSHFLAHRGVVFILNEARH